MACEFLQTFQLHFKKFLKLEASVTRQNENKMAQKILLVDDHAVVRQGLKTLLEQAGYHIVAEADSGERACQLWQELHPDLALMDLEMPGIGGLEAMQRILARYPNARILIFSMYSDNIYAARSMQAGARGYVVKTDAPEVMLDAVKQILRGGRYISHELAVAPGNGSFLAGKKPC